MIKSDTLSSLLSQTPRQVGFAIYALGSTSDSSEELYNPRVSDRDLLFVANSPTFKDHLDHFKSVKKVAEKLTSAQDDLYDTFFMSQDIAVLHFSCLPVLAGDTSLRKENFIWGDAILPSLPNAYLPSEEFRRELYHARAAYLCRKYIECSPEADTSLARKHTKLLMRILKSLLCAYSKVEDLRDTEQILLKINKFRDIQKLFPARFDSDLYIDPIFQGVLNGNSVRDWPQWMSAQYVTAKQLLSLQLYNKPTPDEYLFYSTISEMLQGMLALGVKNLLSAKKDRLETEMEEFVNHASKHVATLALTGVESLKDLESPLTPTIVKQSYKEIVRCLAGEKKADMEATVSALILLEYAVKEGIVYANKGYLED